MAVISKDIKLAYMGTNNDYIYLTNLQSIPELGGDTDAIEITTLADAAHTYTNGIKNYGDSLAFKFLYDMGQFNTLSAFENEIKAWQVALPDGMMCNFSGSCSVKLDGVGVNAALTYTLSIKPTSQMTWNTNE